MAQPKPRQDYPTSTSRHLTVAIYAADLKSLREIVRTHPLDYGCRPHASPDPAGRYFTTALVSQAELDRLRNLDLDVRDLFDQFRRIRWYMDIHSAAGDILFSWGDDDDQVNDPSMQFLNPALDGRRGVVGDPAYREWIEEADYGKVSNASNRVARAMQTVGGRSYRALQAVGLYPTSGAGDDYAYSRYRANAKLNKVYGFTMEFGYPTNFYPTLSEYHANLRDTGAGLMEFCLAAADAGL